MRRFSIKNTLKALTAFAVIFSFFSNTAFAAIVGYNPSHNKINANQAPVVAETDQGEILIAWQDIRPYLEGEIMIQRLNKNGMPLSGENMAVLKPNGKVSYLALDTARDGQFLISWIDEPALGEEPVLKIQKFNAQGKAQWKKPVVVAKMRNDKNQTEVVGLSLMKTDLNGNAFFAWGNKFDETGDIELTYQVVNSEGFTLWKNGKTLNGDAGRYISEPYRMGLALDKKTSIALISWVDGDPYNNFQYKTLNVQKINYDGAYQWGSPYHIYLDGDTNFLENIGIDTDSRGNIMLGYLTSISRTRDTATINIHVMNRLQQPLWSDRDTGNIDPKNIIGTPSLAMDRSQRAYISINSVNDTRVYIYEASSAPSGESNKTIYTFRKDAPKPGIARLSQSSFASVARVDNDRMAVVWNQFFATFGPTRDQTDIRLGNTGDEKIYLEVLRPGSDLLHMKKRVDSQTSKAAYISSEQK